MAIRWFASVGPRTLISRTHVPGLSRYGRRPVARRWARNIGLRGSRHDVWRGVIRRALCCPERQRYLRGRQSRVETRGRIPSERPCVRWTHLQWPPEINPLGWVGLCVGAASEAARGALAPDRRPPAELGIRDQVGHAAAKLAGQGDRLHAPAVAGALTLFLTDARVPLDNNTAEWALRGVVVGRKNHYGSHSKRGAEVAAATYTLFESAKLADVDPHRYVLESAHPAIASPGTPTLPRNVT
ncbi:MAG: hypothetical protein EPN53_04790 [Acidobacteria bacterium]|nr:MAG: hypothetical protein EPN53_04790 [Acidobacteriota bacterium]